MYRQQLMGTAGGVLIMTRLGRKVCLVGPTLWGLQCPFVRK